MGLWNSECEFLFSSTHVLLQFFLSIASNPFHYNHRLKDLILFVTSRKMERSLIGTSHQGLFHHIISSSPFNSFLPCPIIAL